MSFPGKSIRNLARTLRLKGYYQEQRSASAEERWRLIESRLAPQDRSLLDIGCNIGNFTANAAKKGMFAVGVDVSQQFVQRAAKVHRNQTGAAFGWLDITPHTVASLPRTDVTLCLSVHHHWYHAYGSEAAWQMIDTILGKTGKLFFEPASSYARYRSRKPDFAEGDVASIDRYVRSRFQDLGGAKPDDRETRIDFIPGTGGFQNPVPGRVAGDGPAISLEQQGH